MHQRKIFAALICNLCMCYAAYSQTLFTVGAKAIDKAEFLKAFNKNPDTTGSRAEKIKQYLDLYVNFKLKLQAAYDEKLNTDANLKYEADNFRDQLVDNIINEQANINGLIHEAFERSQKDILLSQVFIEVAPGADTADAWNKINQAYNELKGGAGFGDIAAKYSTDEQTKNAKGNIGYITAFSLPYSIENVVYSVKPGAYSPIYKSGVGYHIFQNVQERPAAGKRKLQHILFAVPSNFGTDEKSKIARLADSVYKLVQGGADFSKMLDLYGAPSGTYNAEHTIEVGVGQYTSDFEQQVFALKNKGDISGLFETAYGFNILKLIDAEPVSADENDVINRAHLQELVQNDNRLGAAKNALINKWMTQTKFTPSPFNQKHLWTFTDSAIINKKAPGITDI
ncbi:MAG TPA: peptidylprolyl isomerase, partial [Chitinophagaceae bacterium]|nr:peptidylprolyl isomerase [Chitinophagaceae bacterium]